MKSVIIQFLESKGFNIPTRDYDILTERWKDLQMKKPALDELDLKVNDIAYKHIPGGDHINE